MASLLLTSGRKGRGDEIMKNIKLKLSVLLAVGVLGVSGAALAADGVLLKEDIASGSYCHMRFPAIRPSTLAGNKPELKSSATGDVIDFYGSCDESPVGKDQIASQRLEYEHQFDGAYSD
jgi:hypothetical protein